MAYASEPVTPVLESAVSWDTGLATPPMMLSQVVPREKGGRRIPVASLNLSSDALLSFGPKSPFDKPVDPLRVSLKASSARKKLTVEREFVQCMVCRQSCLVTSAAELVCSHFVHPRCLQQLVTVQSKLQVRDEYPPCEICKYPAKPKDMLLNQSIRTTVQNTVRPITPPPRLPPPCLRTSASPELARSRSSASSSQYSVHSLFQVYDTKVPLQLSVVPVFESLTIANVEPTCQFVVTVTCPDYTYHAIPHITTPQDSMYCHKTVDKFSARLGIPRKEIGSLRLERDIEFSSNGYNWVRAKCFLFSKIFVVVAPGFPSPLMFTELNDLNAFCLKSGPEVAVCIEVEYMDNVVYITSTNRDHLFSIVAALHDRDMQFPLAKSKPNSLLLQSPFGSDYVFCPPCHTVVCIPGSVPLSAVSEVVGRLRLCDKLGVVQYGEKLTAHKLQRQNGEWEKLLSTPAASTSSESVQNDLDLVLSEAVYLFEQASSAAKSIIVISEGSTRPIKAAIPEEVSVYTIGVGESHNAIALSRLAGRYGGSYVYSPRSELSQYITHMCLSERSCTHRNVSIMLRQRQGTVSSVSGFSNSPGLGSELHENANGDLSISLGKLRAGQKHSFVIGVDISENVYKYAVEGAELDMIEVCISGNMIPGDTKIDDRVNARIVMELGDGQRCDRNFAFRKMHLASPITGTDKLTTIHDRVALSTALSLDTLAKHIATFEMSQAKCVVTKLLKHLEHTTEVMSRIFDSKATKLVASIFLDVGLFLDTLMGEIRYIANQLERRDVLCRIFHINWILRSQRSFSRRTNLEAIYFDHNAMNVI